jgi:tRNA modification GTPase
MQQLRGVLSQHLNNIRDALLEVLSPIEAAIEFPEEEISVPELKKYQSALQEARTALSDIISRVKRGRVYRDGISAVICGRPNVGKSSLLNAILKQERSIVTPIAGTTRDTIEETVDIRGVPVRLIDTAGILKPRNLIEKEAVRRARESVDSADIIILVFEASQKITGQDLAFIRRFQKRQALAVINKIDLRYALQKDIIFKAFKHTVEVSAKNPRTIRALEEELLRMVYAGAVKPGEPVFIASLRHLRQLESACKLLGESATLLEKEADAECVAQNIKEALAQLDYVLGRKFSEDMLANIFSQFCIGK